MFGAVRTGGSAVTGGGGGNPALGKGRCGILVGGGGSCGVPVGGGGSCRFSVPGGGRSGTADLGVGVRCGKTVGCWSKITLPPNQPLAILLSSLGVGPETVSSTCPAHEKRIGSVKENGTGNVLEPSVQRSQCLWLQTTRFRSLANASMPSAASRSGTYGRWPARAGGTGCRQTSISLFHSLQVQQRQLLMPCGHSGCLHTPSGLPGVPGYDSALLQR